MTHENCSLKASAESGGLNWPAIRPLKPGRRALDLRDRFFTAYTKAGERIYSEPEYVSAFADAIIRAYGVTPGEPVIMRRARVLREFAEAIPVRVTPDDYFLGMQTFNRLRNLKPTIAEKVRESGYCATTGHIVHDYTSLISKGVAILRGEIADSLGNAKHEDQRVALRAMDAAMAAFTLLIKRHADEAWRIAGTLSGAMREEWETRAEGISLITENRPENFAQALQLVWFAHIFLHAENPSVAISFGRLDQYLWPFLEKDLADDRLDLQGAFDLICAFFIKCCEGEESQNAVLGGVDEAGRDAANPLSLLLVAAMRSVRTFQPSLSVRFHPDAHAEFIEAACELAATGAGNPGFMNDQVVIKGLQEVGIPLERARDWGIVGCYEAVPQGDCYPNTVLGKLHLVDVLADYLKQTPNESFNDFNEFLAGYCDRLRNAYAETLEECQNRWNHFRDNAPSPFGSVLMKSCVKRGVALEGGGADFNLVGINILGLGTVVDSLHAIKSCVYGSREITLEELAREVDGDFIDERIRRRLSGVDGRYGANCAETNRIARELSEMLADMVLESRLADGVRPYPGLFAFSGDIYDLNNASPDGRRKNDLISYGVGPSSAVETTPTAAMASAANLANDKCACGNPLALSLPKSALSGKAGIQRIRSLVQGYFAMGGCHVHFNVTSAEELRRAKADPESNPSLLIRVSGYSTRFINVDPQWQDALIERAELGL